MVSRSTIAVMIIAVLNTVAISFFVSKHNDRGTHTIQGDSGAYWTDGKGNLHKLGKEQKFDVDGKGQIHAVGPGLSTYADELGDRHHVKTGQIVYIDRFGNVKAGTAEQASLALADKARCGVPAKYDSAALRRVFSDTPSACDNWLLLPQKDGTLNIHLTDLGQLVSVQGADLCSNIPGTQDWVTYTDTRSNGTCIAYRQ